MLETEELPSNVGSRYATKDIGSPDAVTSLFCIVAAAVVFSPKRARLLSGRVGSS
jgi:hypothetical protein